MEKNWSKLFLQFSNHIVSFTNLKASFTLFPFYVRKNSWGSWDFNNKLIKMKNKTEKLCRFGSECLFISNLCNHLCPRSWNKIFMGSVISHFGSKDTAITVLLFPCLLHYSLRAQYFGTTKMKTKSGSKFFEPESLKSHVTSKLIHVKAG